MTRPYCVGHVHLEHTEHTALQLAVWQMLTFRCILSVVFAAVKPVQHCSGCEQMLLWSAHADVLIIFLIES